MKNLSERLFDFAVNVVKGSATLSVSYINAHLLKQLIRSATSAGANYEEACAAESRADFIHKLQITLKELRETLYWLRLFSRISLDKESILRPLLTEADELTRIIAKSIVTARKRKP